MNERKTKERQPPLRLLPPHKIPLWFLSWSTPPSLFLSLSLPAVAATLVLLPLSSG